MKYNRFFIIITLLILCSVSNIFSQNIVNEKIASKVGKNFMASKTDNNVINLSLFHQEDGEDGSPCYYIFNVEKGGFVIVAASKDVKPILAYSCENQFKEDIPSNVKYWLSGYRQLVENVLRYSDMVTEQITRQWDDLINGTYQDKGGKSVSPLVETRWNQDCYYNELAPLDYRGPCGHVYSGCVACAMAQLMKYWNYPEHGKGYHSYSYGEYGVCSADFENTYYDWNNMPNEVLSSNNAVATLMYHCGVSVNMMWGADGSGANSNDVETAMRSYFGYCAATYLEKKNYDDTSWIAILKNELDNSRPMYYSGTTSSSGHAFVCDGYDNNDYFHFNWGWSGYGNGYYSLTNMMGFNSNQTIVTNIKPLPINADENGIIYISSDGEGDGSSWENATKYLQYATSVSINTANQIWVKAGTYYGDEDNEKGAFYIYQNNRVYGGFSGNESSDFNLEDRDFEANQTILDGKNKHRVIYQLNHFTNSAYSVWDGFTIMNGNSGAGGGAYLCSNSHFKNCKFAYNHANGFGGAVYVISGIYENSLVKFENCSFESNVGSMGGAIFDMTGTTMINCYLKNNEALTKGGAYYIFMGKEPKIINSIFSGNNANKAGAIYNRGKIIMINCDIVDNIAIENYGGLYNEFKYNKIYNSIFWGNRANYTANQIEGVSNFKNCAVQGGFSGDNMINLSEQNTGSGNQNYPCFESPETGNYAIESTSACINAGDKSINGIPATDILGNDRIVDWQIDIGAIEYQGISAVEDMEDIDLSIYPNPVKDKLIVKGKSINSITIYSIVGQEVTSIYGKQYCEFDVSNFTKGIYIVEIISDRKSEVKKVIVY